MTALTFEGQIVCGGIEYLSLQQRLKEKAKEAFREVRSVAEDQTRIGQLVAVEGWPDRSVWQVQNQLHEAWRLFQKYERDGTFNLLHFGAREETLKVAAFLHDRF